MGCMVDGLPTSCDTANRLIGSGVGVPCRNNDCGPQRFATEGGDIITQPYRCFADGYCDYLPAGLQYVGEGVYRAANDTGGMDTFGPGDVQGLSPINFFAGVGQGGGGRRKRRPRPIRRPHPGKARLSDERLTEYRHIKQYAESLLDSHSCKSFLASFGIIVGVKNALYLQTPYDGLRSTITAGEAGIVSPGNTHFANTRVADLFARGEYAITAASSEFTRYDVYFDASKWSANALIHEALHSATRMNDIDLARWLTGGKYDPIFGKRKASEDISNVLDRHGCGRSPFAR